MTSSSAESLSPHHRDELIAGCLREGVRTLLPCEVEQYRGDSSFENVGYPQGDERCITLGSVFKANAAGEVGYYLMTGYVGEPPKEIQKAMPPAIDIVHVTSPMGLAVLGQGVGAEASYSVRGRSYGITILNVYQFDGVTPIATYDPED